MREPENILSVAAHEPSLMGFIFYRESPRYVGDSFHVPATLSPCVKRVGVTVNQSLHQVKSLVNAHHLNFVQLHGNETVEECKNLYQEGISIIRAFSIDETMDFSITHDYQPYVEYFLFDTKGKHRGGNGRRFDWKLLDRYRGHVPFLVSGGISVEHLTEIERLEHPGFVGIDVNSGVESAPGQKDEEKVKSIVQFFK